MVQIFKRLKKVMTLKTDQNLLNRTTNMPAMDMETSEYGQLLDLRDHPGFTLTPSETDWLVACKEEPSLFREPVDHPERLFRIHHASLSVRFRSFLTPSAKELLERYVTAPYRQPACGFAFEEPTGRQVFVVGNLGALFLGISPPSYYFLNFAAAIPGEASMPWLDTGAIGTLIQRHFPRAGNDPKSVFDATCELLFRHLCQVLSFTRKAAFSHLCRMMSNARARKKLCVAWELVRKELLVQQLENMIGGAIPTLPPLNDDNQLAPPTEHLCGKCKKTHFGEKPTCNVCRAQNHRAYRVRTPPTRTQLQEAIVVSDSDAAPEPAEEPAEEPIEERPAGPAPAPFPEARPRPPAAARYTPSKMPDAEAVQDASLNRQFYGLLEPNKPPSENSFGPSEESAFTVRPLLSRPTPLMLHKRRRSPDPLDDMRAAIAAAQADWDANRQQYDLLLDAHCQLQQQYVQLHVQKVPPQKLRRPLPDIEKVNRLNSISRRPAVADIAHGPVDLPPLMLDAARGTELMAVLNPDCGSADSAWRRGPYQHHHDRSD